MKILILCTGNSCRSQMAHGFLQACSPRLYVRSAGTLPAEQVNPRAALVMQECGIDLSSHRPKNVACYLEESWDYVITVCGNAKESCPHFIGDVKHRLHMGFQDPSESRGDEIFVMNEFRRIRDAIHSEFERFFQEKLAPFL